MFFRDSGFLLPDFIESTVIYFSLGFICIYFNLLHWFLLSFFKRVFIRFLLGLFFSLFFSFYLFLCAFSLLSFLIPFLGEHFESHFEYDFFYSDFLDDLSCVSYFVSCVFFVFFIFFHQLINKFSFVRAWEDFIVTVLFFYRCVSSFTVFILYVISLVI